MKLVLDTNVLISGIFWKGPPYEILKLWIKNEAQIFVTENILREYFDVLHRIDPKRNRVKEWKFTILQNTVILADRNIVRLSRDPHDDMFMNCAMVAHADYLISGDKDLLSLKERTPIKIITPAGVLKL